MTVFKYFLRIVWRYKGLILTQLAIFMFFTFVSTRQLPQADSSFSDIPLTLSVVAPESDPLAEDFIAYLSEKNNVILVDSDETVLREQVYTDAIDGAIILPKDIEQTATAQLSDIQVITSDKSVGAAMLRMDINRYFTFANALIKANNFDTERLRELLNKRANTQILSPNGETPANYTIIWGKYYFNMLGYMLIMLFISLMGVVMADFEGKGVATRQRISALSLLHINRQKFLGGAVVTVILFSLFIALALCIQPTLLQFSEFYHYVAIATVSTLTILSLTYLCVVLAEDKKIVYSSLSTVLGLGLAFTSGVFVPIEFLDSNVQQFAKLFPVYYLVQANEAVLQHESYLQPLMILALFMVTYFVVAQTITRIKQRH
ncbi:ABC transporter permease [Aerococcaceae bacterium NML201209]|nr:ABC transporter permease [Aerococcaceae bacterium NML201209]